MPASNNAEVIVGIISLILSIVVFVITSVINYQERKESLNRDQLILFAQKIDDFIRIVDSQQLLDIQEEIYNTNYDDISILSKQYADLQRIIAKMNYIYQMILLYIPQKTSIIESTLAILDNIKEKYSTILNSFNNDLYDYYKKRRYCKKNRTGMVAINQDFNQKEKTAYLLSVSYDDFFKSSIPLLLKGLSLASRESVKASNSYELTTFLNEYNTYKNAIQTVTVTQQQGHP